MSAKETEGQTTVKTPDPDAVYKRAVVRMVEEDIIYFESEGKIIKVPVKDVGEDLRKLIEEYGEWPGLLPGTEVMVPIAKCKYHWPDPDCWAAYTTN